MSPTSYQTAPPRGGPISLPGRDCVGQHNGGRGDRSVLQLGHGQHALGRIRVPSGRHRDQHPAEVRHHVDADDLRTADLPDADLRSTDEPSLPVARHAHETPAPRSSTDLEAQTTPSIHQDAHTARRSAVGCERHLHRCRTRPARRRALDGAPHGQPELRQPPRCASRRPRRPTAARIRSHRRHPRKVLRTHHRRSFRPSSPTETDSSCGSTTRPRRRRRRRAFSARSTTTRRSGKPQPAAGNIVMLHYDELKTDLEGQCRAHNPARRSRYLRIVGRSSSTPDIRTDARQRGTGRPEHRRSVLGQHRGLLPPRNQR